MLEIQHQIKCKVFFVFFLTKYIYSAYKSHKFNIYEQDKVTLSWIVHGIMNITSRPVLASYNLFYQMMSHLGVK